MVEEKKVDLMEQKSDLNTDLTIRANKTSIWSSKGPDWNISLVDHEYSDSLPPILRNVSINH